MINVSPDKYSEIQFSSRIQHFYEILVSHRNANEFKNDLLDKELSSLINVFENVFDGIVYID